MRAWPRNLVPWVTMLALELCWLAAWSLLVGTWVGGNGVGSLLSLGTMIIAIVGAAVVVAVVGRARWPGWATAAVSAPAVALVALLALRLDYLNAYDWLDFSWLAALPTAMSPTPSLLRAEILAVAFVLLIWWRGSSVALGGHSYLDIRGRLVAAMVLCFGATVAAQIAVQRGLPVELGQDVGSALIACVFVGLLSLSLAKARDVSRYRAGETGLSGRDWATGLAVALGATLVAALVLSLMMGGQTLTLAGNILGRAFDLVTWLLYPVLALLGLLAQLGIFLLSLIPRTPEAQQNRDQPARTPNVWEQAGQAAFSPEAIAILRWVVLGLALLVILILVVRVVRRRRIAEGFDLVWQESESIGSWRDALAALRLWLRGLLAKLWHVREPAPVPVGGAEAIDTTQAITSEARSTRAVYRELLVEARRLGHGRGAAETPHELLRRLRTEIDAGDDLNSVTEAYVITRYGEKSPKPDAVARIVEAWARIRERWSGIGERETPGSR